MLLGMALGGKPCLSRWLHKVTSTEPFQSQSFSVFYGAFPVESFPRDSPQKLSQGSSLHQVSQQDSPPARSHCPSARPSCSQSLASYLGIWPEVKTSPPGHKRRTRPSEAGFFQLCSICCPCLKPVTSLGIVCHGTALSALTVGFSPEPWEAHMRQGFGPMVLNKECCIWGGHWQVRAVVLHTLAVLKVWGAVMPLAYSSAFPNPLCRYPALSQVRLTLLGSGMTEAMETALRTGW